MFLEMFGQTTQAIRMFRKTGAGVVFEENVVIDDGRAECIRLGFVSVTSARTTMTGVKGSSATLKSNKAWV